MEAAQRLLKQYLKLSSKEKKEFLFLAGFSRIPGRRPIRREVKVKEPRKTVEKKIRIPNPNAIKIGHLSFEERMKFFEENATGKFKRKHDS